MDDVFRIKKAIITFGLAETNRFDKLCKVEEPCVRSLLEAIKRLLDFTNMMGK